MSVLHRRDGMRVPWARGISAAPLLDGLAAHALLAMMVARLAVRVARHAVWRGAPRGRAG